MAVGYEGVQPPICPVFQCPFLTLSKIAYTKFYAGPHLLSACGMFEVNFLTGSVLYVGPDSSKMTAAALNNPTSYTVEQRGETVVFTIWRGSEAAVMRFEHGTHTGNIAFRAIQEDEQGAFIRLGQKKVRREAEGA